VDIVEETDRYFIDSLRNKTPGPPEFCEIGGFETASTVWRRKGTLYPATASGVTPSLSLTYWRIPARMAGSSPSSEYPDIDPKYEQVIPFGVARELSRSQTPETQRWQELETEILLQMAGTARAI
jgi:hypothetical protein